MIIFDTETDGLTKPTVVPIEKQPFLIEFAAVQLNDTTLKEEQRVQFLVNPRKSLSEECKKITKMTDEQLKDAHPFDYHLGTLIKLFGGQRIMLSHFLPFDHQVLQFELLRSGYDGKFPWPPVRICTVEASKGIKGHNLSLSDLHMIVEGKKPEERLAFKVGQYIKHKSLGKGLILAVEEKLIEVKLDNGKVKKLKPEMLKGAAFEGAHGAMKDVLILADCVRWLRKGKYL
jgi:DNA polymerase III epsilon subunit-like protein